MIVIQDVPVNELHSKGYVSIGCQPCTRPVLPNQHEREGRWWWEDAAGKECGLHVGNVSSGSAEQVNLLFSPFHLRIDELWKSAAHALAHSWSFVLRKALQRS